MEDHRRLCRVLEQELLQDVDNNGEDDKSRYGTCDEGGGGQGRAVLAETRDNVG